MVALAPNGAQSGPVEFKPAQLVQGGTAVVYLTAAATSATARFGGLQYPMLQSGNRWWAIIGIGALAAPGSAPVSVSYTPPGQSAAVMATSSITILKRDFPVERIDLSPSTAALLAPDIITAELNQRAGIYGGFTPQRFWSGPFLRPSTAAIGDVYGTGRSYNGAPVTDYHRGLDFVSREGDPLTAAAAGRVTFAGELKVRGNSVIIDHGAGVFTAYHHLSRIDVAQGQAITAGQQVGLCGSTGLVTGPHLHWEVLVRGVEVDGELWLKGQEMGP
jgi:murein DD-endopeptidase MepM/ murein hydrolase activator NlpD